MKKKTGTKKYLKKKKLKEQLKKNENTPRQIKFLTVKKNDRDKFEDVISKYKHSSFTVNKHGETVFSQRKFKKIIQKELGISPKALKKYFAGVYTKAQKKKINKIHRGGKYEKTKRETKAFTKHTFTWTNFFKKNIRKRKKFEQYYFRCGLRMVFRSKNSGKNIYYNNELVQVWEIPNVPVSHYTFKGYPMGYKEFYSKIKIETDKYPSLLFFSFNYFDVTILDMRK